MRMPIKWVFVSWGVIVLCALVLFNKAADQAGERLIQAHQIAAIERAYAAAVVDAKVMDVIAFLDSTGYHPPCDRLHTDDAWTINARVVGEKVEVDFVEIVTDTMSRSEGFWQRTFADPLDQLPPDFALYLLTRKGIPNDQETEWEVARADARREAGLGHPLDGQRSQTAASGD